MEDQFNTNIDDLWSALTDPRRLARWLGEVNGDLCLGGEFRALFFATGWEGSGRVEVCKPPQRLLVRTKEVGEANGHVIEATLLADGDQTRLTIEERGMPVEQVAGYGAAYRSTSKISPPTSPATNAATRRRVGRSSCLLIEAWPPTSAEHHRMANCLAVCSGVWRRATQIHTRGLRHTPISRSNNSRRPVWQEVYEQ